jgi:hypothetical protein
MMKMAIPALLFLLVLSPACKKTETSRIEGTWTLHIVFPGSDPSELVIKLAGNDSTGSVKNKNDAVLGNYFLAYPEISFNVQVYYNDVSGNLIYLFTGALTDDTHMAGTVTGYFSNYPLAKLDGTWTGTK